MLYYDKICAEYAYKTELHSHTKPVSCCSDKTPREVVEAYSAIGCHTLAVTNHINPSWSSGMVEKYLAGYYDTVRAAEGTGMNVVLAVEIRFPENYNDYLVYGVKPEDIEPMLALVPYGIAEFYHKIKREDNLILQAHPFRDSACLVGLDCIDGIEALNMHPGHNSRVALACRYAHQHGLIVSGGSDYHHEGHEGMCLLRTRERMNSSFDIARVLKSGDCVFDMNGAIVIPEQHGAR